MGKFAGSMIHRNFPIAGNFPTIRPAGRISGHCCTTVLLTSRYGAARSRRMTG
jgi:hypothetical protein